MQPRFNSFPHLPNQSQNNSTVSPQVLSPHIAMSNSFNMIPNSMPMQPQLGIVTPQISMPLNNSNTYLGNGQGITVPNMGIPQLGFGLQNLMHNVNVVPMLMNQVNPLQPQVQMFATNFSNMRPHQLNQNVGLPNGQFCVQNVNHVSPLQLSNPPQVFPQQTNQNMGHQNPAFYANRQFGLVGTNQVGQQVNQHQQNVVIPMRGMNANPCSQLSSSSVQQQQTQNLRPPVSVGSQGNPLNMSQNYSSNPKRKDISSKNFPRNPKQEGHQRGFQKSQSHQVHNAKRKFGFSNDHKGKGRNAKRAAKFVQTNSMNQARENKRRSLALSYTDQEIRQWREERRKNYPSKVNVEKKLTRKVVDSEIIDREVQLRREQLKEILAKQAELGVEVAEIPPHYLMDSKKQGYERSEKGRPLPKGKFLNKRHKGGKFNKRGHFKKKQKFAGKVSSNDFSLHKSKPTLLQKLLSADIRREKRQLLQVFRFMVMNSFFEDSPGKPLRFPSVIVKENGFEVDVGEGISSLASKDVSEGSSKAAAENFDGGDHDDDVDDNAELGEDDDDEDLAQVGLVDNIGNDTGDGTEKPEEEGEIID